MNLPGYDAWLTTDPRDAEPTEPPHGICCYGRAYGPPCEWPKCDCMERAEEDAAEMKRQDREDDR